MSWNLNLTGHRAAVKAKVLAETHVPEGIKQTIADLCDDVQRGTPNGIRVVGYGHSGGGFGSVGKLEVESVIIHLDEPQAANALPPPPLAGVSAFASN